MLAQPAPAPPIADGADSPAAPAARQLAFGQLGKTPVSSTSRPSAAPHRPETPAADCPAASAASRGQRKHGSAPGVTGWHAQSYGPDVADSSREELIRLLLILYS